jgi:multiple sugar transport system permease protein
VLSASDFPRYFLNSMIVSLSTAVIVTAIASFAGYALSRFRFNGKTAVSFLLLMTQTFPLVMVIPPIYRIMGSMGLTDNLYGLIVIYTAFNIAFATFLMQSFFDGVPRDLEEAAMIDGCTRLLALRKIIVPLTLPGMGATLAFVFTAAWSELLFALMLINREDQKTFSVGLLTFVGKFAVDWGQMMAASVMALIPVCLFFLFLQRYLVTGLTAGAVKG